MVGKMQNAKCKKAKCIISKFMSKKNPDTLLDVKSHWLPDASVTLRLACEWLGRDGKEDRVGLHDRSLAVLGSEAGREAPIRSNAL